MAKKKVVKKKKIVKRPAKKKVVKKEKPIGEITHYFPKVQAAVVKMKSSLRVGEKIKVKGHTTEFSQEVTSMQIDRVAINEAKKGNEIGLQVSSRVRGGDLVYRLDK